MRSRGPFNASPQAFMKRGRGARARISDHPASSPPPAGTDALTATFKINVVFVGYGEQDIDLARMKAVDPTVYSPIVRKPLHYGIDAPVGIQEERDLLPLLLSCT